MQNTDVIIPYEPAMEGILPIMLILRDMELLSINRKRPVLDSIGISANNSAKVCPVMVIVVYVHGGVIVPDHNVCGLVILVMDEQVGYTSTVSNEAVDQRRFILAV